MRGRFFLNFFPDKLNHIWQRLFYSAQPNRDNILQLKLAGSSFNNHPPFHIKIFNWQSAKCYEKHAAINSDQTHLSRVTLKRIIKNHFLSLYGKNIELSNQFYVKKISTDFMKMTIARSKAPYNRPYSIS